MAVKMPIRNPAVPPSAIAGELNGYIPRHLLAQVDHRTADVWLMASLPARGMRALHAAIFARFGVRMTSTGRGRTLWGQWDIFGGPNARYEPCSWATYLITPSARRKSWQPADRAAVARALNISIPDSTYWRKIKRPDGTYPATAAVPGTSDHGRWCADDMALPDDADADTYPEGINDRPDILEWLYLNEHLYGFAHSLASEIWHVHWINGDVVPPAVLAYEAGAVIVPPVVEKPDPTVPERPPVVTPPVITLPTNGDLVYRIIVVDCPHPTIPGARQRAAATFYGTEVQPGGIIPEIEWSGPGSIAKVAHRLATLKALGVQERVLNLEDLLGIRLKDGAAGLPRGDWFGWSLDHFANTAAV